MATSICRSLDRRKTQFRIRVNVTQTNGISIKNKNDITPQFDSFSLGFRLPLTFQATSGGLQRSKKVGIAGSYPHVDAVTLFLSGDARLERCQPLTLSYIKMPCLEKQKKICSVVLCCIGEKKTQVNDVRQVIYSLSLTEELSLV